MIFEKKILLSGEVQTFSCEMVHFAKDFGILKYIINRNYDISGVQLRPGDITFALYWTDRPYTLYIWHLNQQKDTAYYFNIADKISLQPTEFIWRDLAVDILVDVQRNVHVLDEDELPVDLSPELSGYIRMAREHILTHFRNIIQEANTLMKSKFP
jgi:hypothetical protein